MEILSKQVIKFGINYEDSTLYKNLSAFLGHTVDGKTYSLLHNLSNRMNKPKL